MGDCGAVQNQGAGTQSRGAATAPRPIAPGHGGWRRRREKNLPEEARMRSVRTPISFL